MLTRNDSVTGLSWSVLSAALRSADGSRFGAALYPAKQVQNFRGFNAGYGSVPDRGERCQPTHDLSAYSADQTVFCGGIPPTCH